MILYLIALAPLVVIIVGLRMQPVRTAAFLLPFLPLLLIVGTVLAFTTRNMVAVVVVMLAWGAGLAGLLYVTRGDNPVPVDDPEDYRELVEPWLETGLTEVEIFRLRPGTRSVVIALRGPVKATVLVLAVRDATNAVGTWALSTPLGDGEGALVTTTDPVGLLDFGEVRQIIDDKDDAWATHQDGLVFCTESGIAANREIGETLRDHVLWMRNRDRWVARRFPLGFLAMMFRPMFHLGRLRGRRRAGRQLRGLTRIGAGS